MERFEPKTPLGKKLNALKKAALKRGLVHLSADNILEKKDLDYYLSLPYTIEIVKYEDGGFFATVKELEGCMTEGDTISEVLSNIEDAKKAWLEAALDDGLTIPEPETATKQFTGKLLCRLPKSLHRRLYAAAKQEGVSMNTLVVTLLSKGLVLQKQKEDL